MPKSRNTLIQTELLGEHLLHTVGMYRVELGIVCALCDDDDGLALADGTLLSTSRLAMSLSVE